ncbi:MAG: UDP-N-acetylmuramoyl-tripeptide--D-alanyl-D-alanine ligase [Marinirhabdus sp.]|nr:UDP-N-acetylmuramoyl-tripeptide--D-alanyl-D-alanine ligase [Marinirhabdus sp.]
MQIEALHNLFLKSNGVCTDTRKITENCLFFALKGDNFNGNTFANEALERGASHAVIDDLQHHQSSGKTILCKDVLSMLQQLAMFHRNYLNLPIIGLTGSNGKTTTKELIAAVLSTTYTISATKGNLNNHIGVPLTLLDMYSGTEMGIVEMGANHQKEIEKLCSIAQPDYGYITNFGKAHLEGFGGVEGVIKGKTELYAFLKQSDGTAFTNANDPKQMELSLHLSRYTLGTDSSDCPIHLLDASEFILVKYHDQHIKSNLVGKYNYHNIAAAIAIGQYFKVSPSNIKTAIEGYIPSNNRSQLIEKNGHHILLDAYNANPTSMMAAIENFEQSNGEHKVLILGDMFELGEAAADEHQQITSYLEKHPFGKVYLVGENFFKTTHSGAHITLSKTFEDFKASLKNNTFSSNHILIKGSRGMALERVLEVL